MMGNREKEASKREGTFRSLQKLRMPDRAFLLLQDSIVVSALLIVAIALAYLINFTRYQWLLFLLLSLGILMNGLLLLDSLLREKTVFSVAAGLFVAVLLGVLIFLAAF